MIKNTNDAYDYKTQLIGYLTQNNKLQRCCHITKKGKRCHLKSKIHNYGYCHIHNKEYLNEEKYELFMSFINSMLLRKTSWVSQFYYIDCAKKLIIKYGLNRLDEISYYWHIFYKKYSTNDSSVNPINPLHFYDHFNLKKPPSEWLQKCIDNKIIY